MWMRVSKQTVFNLFISCGFVLMFVQLNLLHQNMPQENKNLPNSGENSEKDTHNTNKNGTNELNVNAEKAGNTKEAEHKGANLLSLNASQDDSNQMADNQEEDNDDTFRPNCDKLTQGSLYEFTQVKTMLGDLQRRFVTADNYVKYTEDCDDFIRNRKYKMDVTQEEGDFPLAFSIVTYKTVEQTEKLLRAIYRPSNYYCIHVDKKTEENTKTAFNQISRCFNNVFISSRSVNVKWGTFSVIEPEFICMQDLLKYSWRYFINLTGQDFPLKTNLELVQILKSLRGANLVDGSMNLSGKKDEEFTKRWKEHAPAPHKIKPIKGNSHIAVIKGFVEFILHDKRVVDFTSWVKKTRMPDETFFSSVNYNPHLRAPGGLKDHRKLNHSVLPYIARFKNWGTAWGTNYFNWPCQGKRVRELCVFGVGDLPLLTTRQELFVNKLDIEYDPYAIDCLEEWMNNKESQQLSGESQFKVDFYRNLYVVKNRI
ncbi:beta-1,3-galactosyl-O-glycosyl-glycoprotein beta-1,6-N-acetylglucosaminyltransferase isoform X2 [Patella vulgata]|nr:beta-1,3-galactosyl-O-glycosyl-glycoprotein beta-1,6-N-acetylglucosaminyltransferase isoform X2 [Patella vulgata]XP_050399019.2 beta-1,3-galactosyl-O-glycosyl-glycoprotein beta-1,6-N-acetylglucosaminyltransferase isoform X2 [Patella vulgata]XP_050399027.2 beta-1,3-galactosyl-O-glycosyl-glycoprotein beta-1,6-N-acetylglucosaminyltransferase isoform X2 [Patella vulgata]